MDTQFDSESYWNRSSSTAFSFDDDDDLDGATTDFASLSTKWDNNAIFNDDTISEASFDNSAALGTLNLSIKSIINDEALKLILKEQTLDDRVLPKGVSPEEELKLLRRQIQSTLYSPSPEATAYKLLHGKTTQLEVFKSLQEKQELLEVLLKNGGGDAVIGVLLFLKRTLNTTQFHNILQQHPKALEHYLSFLRQSGDISVCIEQLQRFGRSQDAALLQFQAVMGVSDVTTRKQQLQRLVDTYATAGIGIIPLYEQVFHAALKLHQLIEKERNNLGKQLSEQSAPIEVLYACCAKNSNWKEQDMLKLISPQRFSADQQISAAQYEWTALNERARAQAYADLECIFERVPTWHPMKSKQFHISFDLALAVQRLYELKAPPSVLQLFLAKMSNSSEKLALAQRVKCTKGVIDAMAGLKQLQELQQLRDKLPDRSEEQFYCENALKAMQSKRWTTDNIKLKL